METVQLFKTVQYQVPAKCQHCPPPQAIVVDAANATAVGCWYLFSANTAPLPEVVAVGIAVAAGTCLVPTLPLSPKLLV